MLVKEFLSKLEMSLSSQVREGKWVQSTQSYPGDSICPLLDGAGTQLSAVVRLKVLLQDWSFIVVNVKILLMTG